MDENEETQKAREIIENMLPDDGFNPITIDNVKTIINKLILLFDDKRMPTNMKYEITEHDIKALKYHLDKLG